MVDFRVRDTIHDHPKMLGIPLAALGLWTYAGAWSAKHLTDGLIPTTAINHLPNWRRLSTELEDRHLWEPVNGGWAIVDWDQHQRTRAQVEAERAAGRERLARYNARRKTGG